MDTYTCEGECEGYWPEDDNPNPAACNAQADYYRCTRPRGHSGNHVACSSDECNMHEWENKAKRSKPIVRPEWAGPITITIGAVELEIISPEAVWLRTKTTALHTPLNAADIKRLIRALTMAVNLQQPPPTGEHCGGCNGAGFLVTNDLADYLIARCDSCERFATDYDAWLHIIPDESRLESDEGDE